MHAPPGGGFFAAPLPPANAIDRAQVFGPNFLGFVLREQLLMARRGRKPKPARLKILEGTRRDRRNSGGPRPAAEAPAPPDHLDTLGREAWQRLAPQLAAMGLLTELEGEALSLYCVTYSRWRLALEELHSIGISVETGQGSLKPNPAAAVVAESSRLMASLLAEFGLTPASRSRVAAASEPPVDALAEFLSRKKG
jgi:P27 family predicted phage terminase small subunit